MQSQEFWVKYLTNQAIPIDTHYIGENERKKPLISVAHLNSAFQNRPGSSLANIGSENIFLCLPSGLTRKDCAHLGADAFFSEDEDETRLRPGLSLASLGFLGRDDRKPLLIKVNAGELQLELDYASKRQHRAPPVVWKEDPDIIYSPEEGNMFFVNREKAMSQLQEIHKKKFQRASTGVGSNWGIPLVDNVFGLGKSELGRHYIKKCRETWPIPKNEFEKTLCACHTVNITFSKGSLLCDEYECIIKEELIRALKPRFDQYLPEELKNNPKVTFRNFLTDLSDINCAGPLFIVLDEIGSAFHDESLDDIQMRDLFIGFCSKILSQMLLVKNVFFVVLGRASFLGYVGLRPIISKQFTPSPFEFKRLNLHLIRPDAIVIILNNTFMDNDRKTTVSAHLKLEDDKAVKEAATILFEKTNGHPRSLLNALSSCHSLQDIRAYKLPICVEDEDLFFQILFRYKDQIMEFANCICNESRIDLTRTIRDPGGKLVSYDYISNNALISWEETMNEARLYAHPYLTEKLNLYVLPFKEYIRHVAKSLDNVSVDFANVFEWMCLKRFQELFASSQAPHQVLPQFFPLDEVSIFCSLDSLEISWVIYQVPKIADNGNFSSGELSSPTASPKDWMKILKLVNALGNVCLKHRPLSASCDALIVTRTLVGNKMEKIAIGLASSSEFSMRHLRQESSIFNRTFIGSEKEYPYNILIVCCTKYDSSLKSTFFNKSFALVPVPNEFKNISEIILLNLSSPELRSAFFGISGDLALALENIIRKSERQ